MNAITIDTSDNAALPAIALLPFVQSTSGIAAKTSDRRPGKFNNKEKITPLPSSARGLGMQGDFFNYGNSSFNEIHLQKGEFLHNIGLRGQGLEIAMLDGGFLNYNVLHAFDSAMANGQILSTWDFVDREASVVEDNSHGMMCLSTIAANIPGQFVGKAPKASFHLFRTEDAATEQRIEEFNWACGAERADSAGADVISTSLGYSIYFTPPSTDHPYSDMNGNTTLAAIAGDMAAKKGILVFASIGNDGNEPVNNYLSTPSDGDSVVAVGAVNSSGTPWAGTSYGPSADGQVKPDVASVGWAAVVQNVNNTIGLGTGTSFASPNMAGLATCLWQGFPEFNNMRIVRALREAGSISSAPNNRIGYGIPDMKSAFSSLLTEFATSSATVNACNVTLSWTTKDVSSMRYEIERKIPGASSYSKIADVPSQAGTLLSNRSYQFTNSLTNVPAGTVSYRIRQVIDTALASSTGVYIDTASVVLTSGCTTTGTNDPSNTEEKIIAMPNPTNGDANLFIQTPYPVPSMQIQVHDMKGRLVGRWMKSKASGSVTLKLPMTKLSAGKYLISVYNRLQLIGTREIIKL
jgi:hypothetical protein